MILPIKKQWFDMILSGEKREEYRDIKPYYTTRFAKEFDLSKTIPLGEKSVYIEFRNGYGRNVPRFVADCTLKKHCGKPEWGAEPNVEYYVLHIHKIIWKSMDNLGGYLK